MTTYEAGQSFSELPGDRHTVSANASETKPALVEDAGSTLVVGPGGAAEVTPSGSILVEIG